ncbi:MAG: HAD family hydrolase [Paracoccaceae bacterium]
MLKFRLAPGARPASNQKDGVQVILPKLELEWTMCKRNSFSIEYRSILQIFAAIVIIALPASGIALADPLPSWNDGAAKQAILDLVKKTTKQGSEYFVAPEDRIATFDQDGTTWVSHPLYGQALFALDRVKEMAPRHPEWKEDEPFKSVLSGDRAAMAEFTEHDWMEIVAVTHSGMGTAGFESLVAAWLPTSRNPAFDAPVTDLVYQPMIEVMTYLRANGFRTFIVTGGGQEFVRVYAQDVYGIPPEQVVGSSIVTKFEMVDGVPALVRDPKVFFINDKGGKAVGINLFIGKRPMIAFGNSDGDKEMLQWTTAGEGARLGFLVLHDDAERELAYGPANGLPDTKVGTFSQSLMNTAKESGWIVISMKNDWKTIFAGDIKIAK